MIDQLQPDESLLDGPASGAGRTDYAQMIEDAQRSEAVANMPPAPDMPDGWRHRFHPVQEAKDLISTEATFTQSARHLAEFEGSFREADENSPHGYYRDLPILGRDSLRINGGIDVVGKIVVQAETDPSLVAAAARFDYSRDRTASTDIDELREVYRFTRATMRYDKDASEVIRSRAAQGITSPNEPLGTYIDAGVGVCQMQSLLAAYLTERLVDSGELKGHVGVNRSLNVHENVGHEWMVWVPETGEDLVLDPAQEFVGTRAQAEKEMTKVERWAYGKQPPLTDQDQRPSVSAEKHGLPATLAEKDYLPLPALNDRQQRKIAAIIYTGDLNLVSTGDGDFDSSTGETGKAKVIKALGRVENLAPYAEKLISNIQPNHQRADFSLTDTFDRLHHSEDDPSMHAMAVLAILRGQDLSSRADMTADDLQGLITALPDVVAFEAHANLLIEEVLVVNGQSKADQYALAANRLSQAVYGKQKEYWDQLRILHQEAKNTPSAPKSRWRFGRS